MLVFIRLSLYFSLKRKISKAANAILFSDEIVLVRESLHELKTGLDIVPTALEEKGLKVSIRRQSCI